jgi:hypothetical protein
MNPFNQQASEANSNAHQTAKTGAAFAARRNPRGRGGRALLDQADEINSAAAVM